MRVSISLARPFGREQVADATGPNIRPRRLSLRGCRSSCKQSIDTYRSRSRVLLRSFPSLRRSCSIRFSRTRSSARASTRSFSSRCSTASSRARSTSFDTYGCISLQQRRRGRGLSSTAAGTRETETAHLLQTYNTSSRANLEEPTPPPSTLRLLKEIPTLIPSINTMAPKTWAHFYTWYKVGAIFLG